MDQRQTERMHRTIKDAAVRVPHYAAYVNLEAHIAAFVTAYTFAKHLKGLRLRTRFQAMGDSSCKDCSAVEFNPHHFIPGLHA